MFLAKTIDDKIDQLKHNGTISIPRENLLANLPIIETIIFNTRPYKFITANDGDEFDEMGIDMATDGGSRNYE